MQLSAPELAAPAEKRAILNLYPAGKEDAAELPGGYRCIVSLVPAEDGSDPYMTGRLTFNFKLFKGSEEKLSGRLPAGGEVAKDGYRIAFPDCRRLVITDFIKDYGVQSIWASCVLFLLAFLVWLPLRLVLPRRELLLAQHGGHLVACSRTEGRERAHAGVFHEVLDIIEAGRGDTAREAR